MLVNFKKALKKSFSSLLKFILLVLICLIFSFVIVWPLWKWATVSPESYSIILLSLLACFLVYKIVKKILSSVKASKTN